MEPQEAHGEFMSRCRMLHGPTESVLLEHYRQLNEVGRAYDRQLWLIPGAAYTIVALAYGFLFSSKSRLPVNLQQPVILVTAAIFLGFVVQLLNEHAYHLKNRDRLSQLRVALGIDTVLRPQRCTGLAKWWTKSPNRAFWVVASVMLVALVAQVALATIRVGQCCP